MVIDRKAEAVIKLVDMNFYIFFSSWVKDYGRIWMTFQMKKETE